MESRKIVMMTLYARQQKRHRCVEGTFGLRGKGRGWDEVGGGRAIQEGGDICIPITNSC